MENVKKMLGDVFLQVADAIETGKFGNRPKIGITILGSEHGTDNLIKGAELASKTGNIDVCLIGPKNSSFLETVEVADESEMYAKMEELLDSKYINGCVTMHYNFPMGVSTVGRAVTPAFGREMYIATTTGTTATHRLEAMFKNTINGIAVAKAMGIAEPTVGILNVDGARALERSLNELKSNGYKINFSESIRSDGGAIMRGNDLLSGSVDVMITDTLTGNILMKMFSSYQTGGSYEAFGYGYGPGIGEDYKRLILILSRASGVPVVANAILYAAKLAEGNVIDCAKEEYASAKKAGLDKIIAGFVKPAESAEEVAMPPKEVVTEEIKGIDIMELEEAVTTLWKGKIYAESGMGCTGPIVLVNKNNAESAVDILVKAGYSASL